METVWLSMEASELDDDALDEAAAGIVVLYAELLSSTHRP
jgi:hypothetical protein